MSGSQFWLMSLFFSAHDIFATYARIVFISPASS